MRNQIQNRLQRLEKDSRKVTDGPMVIVNQYIDSDGSLVQPDGYFMPDHKRLYRASGESTEALEDRAASCCKELSTAPLVELQPIITTGDMKND